MAKKKNTPADRGQDGTGPRSWTGSRIKSAPYVTNKYTDRSGAERKRTVDEMLRILKRRLTKSGIHEAAALKREYVKPSTVKRRIKKDTDYRLQKTAKADKEIERLRDIGK